MNIALTGASGFLGSNLRKLLSDNNCNVIPIRYPEDFFFYSPPRSGHAANHWNPKIVEGRARSFADIDVFIHLGWDMQSKLNDEKAHKESAFWGLTVIQAALQAKVPRILVVGTCLEYPFLSQVSDLVRMSGVPKTAYGFWKNWLHCELNNAKSFYQSKITWARVFQVFGENEDRTRLYPQLRMACSKQSKIRISNPGAIRDFIPATEASRMLMHDALCDSVSVTNVCSGVSTSVLSFAQSVMKSQGCGASSLLEVADPPDQPPRSELVGIRRKPEACSCPYFPEYSPCNESRERALG